MNALLNAMDAVPVSHLYLLFGIKELVFDFSYDGSDQIWFWHNYAFPVISQIRNSRFINMPPLIVLSGNFLWHILFSKICPFPAISSHLLELVLIFLCSHCFHFSGGTLPVRECSPVAWCRRFDASRWGRTWSVIIVPRVITRTLQCNHTCCRCNVITYKHDFSEFVCL